jgi:hypothetical protein
MNELFGLGLTGGAGGDASLDEAALNELAEIARDAAQRDASSEPEPEPHFESDSKAEPPA